jgi:VanZ family protein
MTMIAATWFGTIKQLQPHQIGLSITYFGLFGALWLKSFPWLAMTSIRGWTWFAGMTTLTAMAIIAFLVVCARPSRHRADGQTLAACLFCIFCAALIAWLSGSSGGAAPFYEFLRSRGLAENLAELTNFIFRKTVHFAFYGVFALAAYRTARLGGSRNPALGALLFVICHSVFDEVRQWGVPDRSGSPLDVLLDLAGVTAFLYWAHRRSPRNLIGTSGNVR